MPVQKRLGQVGVVGVGGVHTQKVGVLRGVQQGFAGGCVGGVHQLQPAARAAQNLVGRKARHALPGLQ